MSLSDHKTNRTDDSGQWTPLVPQAISMEGETPATHRDPEEAFNTLYEAVVEKDVVVFEPLYSDGAGTDSDDRHFFDDELAAARASDEKVHDRAPSPLPSSLSGNPSPEAGDQKAEMATPDPDEKEKAARQQEEKALQAALAKAEQEGYEAGFAKGEKEGYEAGMTKGQTEGFDAGLVSAGEKVAFLEQLLTEINDLGPHLVKRYEKQIIQMICRISEKVVYTQAPLNHETVRQAILDVFENMGELEDVTVNVNPEDYEFIQIVKEDFFQKFKDLKQLSVAANPSVARGGSKIETRSGQVETSIESRLEAVKNSILNIAGPMA